MCFYVLIISLYRDSELALVVGLLLLVNDLHRAGLLDERLLVVPPALALRFGFVADHHLVTKM